MIVGFQRTLYSDIINTLFDSTLAIQSCFSLITREILGKIDDNLPFRLWHLLLCVKQSDASCYSATSYSSLKQRIEHTDASLGIFKTNTLFEAYAFIRIRKDRFTLNRFLSILILTDFQDFNLTDTNFLFRKNNIPIPIIPIIGLSIHKNNFALLSFMNSSFYYILLGPTGPLLVLPRPKKVWESANTLYGPYSSIKTTFMLLRQFHYRYISNKNDLPIQR